MNELTDISDEIFAVIARELSVGQRNEALWTKAYALQNGNEVATKAQYIRLRAEQLRRNPEDETKVKQGARSLEEETISKRWTIGKIGLLILGSLIVLWLVKSPLFNIPATSAPTTLPSSVEKDVPTAPQPVTGPINIDIFSGVTLDLSPGDNRINLNGTITESMATEFVRVLAEVRARFPGKGASGAIAVVVDSKGGDIYAAMKIGRAIRNTSNVSVIVWQGSECFSSCIFILAGGESRHRLGAIGIHRPYLVAPISDPAAIKHWFAKLSTDAKAYLREMNVKEALFDDMVNVSPENIRIFKNVEEMDHYGLIEYDPIFEEKIAAGQMKRFGISTKADLYERRRNVERECRKVPDDQLISCMERVMGGR